MQFSDLLIKENIELDSVLILRHTPNRETEGALRKVLPWLAAEKPELFNAYQQTQNQAVEAVMLEADYVASFIGLEREAGDLEHTAVFVGLYKVGDHRSLTFEQFWNMPQYNELKRFGMVGFQGDRPSLLWFDLTITEFYKKWIGKLVIEWPRPPIRWWRWANTNSFPIHAVLKESALLQTMPDWKQCIWSWMELAAIPTKWKEALRHWRGIYYISDCSDGKGYVGAAYGEHNIFGRWEQYRELGHGGNALLRERSPENLRFSILQRLGPDTDPNEVIQLESTWKDRLHTRFPEGLNDN